MEDRRIQTLRALLIFSLLGGSVALATEHSPQLTIEFEDGTQAACRYAGDPGSPDCSYYICEGFARNQKACRTIFKVSGSRGFFTDVSTVCEGEQSVLDAVRVIDQDVVLRLLPVLGNATADAVSVLPAEFLPYRAVLSEQSAVGRRQCSSPELSDLFKKHDEARSTLLRRLNQVELVTWVERAKAGSPRRARLIPRATLPATAHQLDEGIFAEDAAADLHLPHSFSGEAVELARAQELMQAVLTMDDLPFEFVSDTCYARAELIAQRLRQEGADVEKIWMTGQNLGPSNAPGVFWRYHVAPVIRVRLADGRVEVRVIDPTTRPTLLSIDEWVRSNYRGTHLPLMTVEAVASSGWYARPLLYFSPPGVYSPGPDELPAGNGLLSRRRRRTRAWADLLRNHAIAEDRSVSRQFSDRPLFMQWSDPLHTVFVTLARAASVYSVDSTRTAVVACMQAHLQAGSDARLEVQPGQTQVTNCW